MCEYIARFAHYYKYSGNKIVIVAIIVAIELQELFDFSSNLFAKTKQGFSMNPLFY